MLTRGYVLDGNFSAEHLRMKNPDDEVILTDGTAFFVKEMEYKNHLKLALETKQVSRTPGFRPMLLPEFINFCYQRSTCNDHKAVNRANAERHKLEATGIGAAACSRHGFFVPHSVVDFQKGERQMNMDYTLCQALNYNSDGIPRTVVCYDIACQFFIHFEERVRNSPYLSLPADMTIEKAIGQFHIHGHQEDCFPKYSPNFIPGIGQVDGEIIETLWSQLNEVSGSTRSMSKFHRRETLNDHMNDSNWKKLLRMVSALIRKFKNASRQRKIADDAFQELTISADPVMVDEWQVSEKEALDGRLINLDAMKIFDVSLQKGSEY
jgi:hypothetical protein